MDSPKQSISLKTTIASRRVVPQKTPLTLSINTRNSQSATTAARHCQATAPALNASNHSSMSPEELSSKIADSFQQFSNMLTQLSKNKPYNASIIPTDTNSNTPTKHRKETRPPTEHSATVSKKEPVTMHQVPSIPHTKEKQDKRIEKEAFFDDISDNLNAGNTKLRHCLIIKWLNRAATLGDIKIMQDVLGKAEIDINATDDKDTGINALMYAAYFGHVECTKLLLKQSKLQINYQDKRGWTALVWAAHGNQSEIIQLLLSHGANKTIRINENKTIFEYSLLPSIKALLEPIPRPDNKNVYSMTAIFSQPPMSKSDVLTEPHKINPLSHRTWSPSQKPVTLPDFSQLLQNIEPTEQDIQEWAASIQSFTTFSWHQCLPDQMFVFSQDDINMILDHALTINDPESLVTQDYASHERWQPANVIFLSARFAHYYSSKTLLNTLLSTAATKMARVIKAGSRETQRLAYWMANLCQLTSYLKKDLGLSVSTLEIQEVLSELISETYALFITESQKRLSKILEASLMDYESIQELEQVDFADDWYRFFRRSSVTSTKSLETTTSTASERKNSTDSCSSISTKATSLSMDTSSFAMSPYAVTRLISHLQSVLQSYYIPPTIMIQATAQFFHYLSCEIFNRILTNKKYMCRSRALQIRMNLSILEDWVRVSKLPPSLCQSFEPLVQLLQLLQCLSQIDDVDIFHSTVQSFDQLNTMQIRRCVQQYRYEISETPLSEQVLQYANQLVFENQQPSSIDAVPQKATRRPNSIYSLNCLLGTVSNKRRLSNEDITSLQQQQAQQKEEEEEEITANEQEKRNSKYLLPFSLSTTTALLRDWTHEQHKKLDQVVSHDILLYSDAIYKDIKLKRQERFNRLDKICPVIAEEWLYLLDKKLRIRS